MARKPNYGQQRADINRSKQAKKEEKLRERDEAVARRKAEQAERGDEPKDEPPRD